MTDSNQEQPRKAQFWNRVQIILILVVFTAPIVGAIFYQPTEFNNYGDLYVPARQIQNLTMQSSEGTVELDSFRRQWIFLVTAKDACDEVCEANILKMRQLRFMQNNDMSRIRTVFLHAGLNDSVENDLAAKYRPIESYSVSESEFDRWGEQLLLDDAPEAAQKQRFYIIDPAGNLMMSYPPSADPNLIKKDIKRLLKASQIG